jgi:predicted transcriptional regulator
MPPRKKTTKLVSLYERSGGVVSSGRGDTMTVNRIVELLNARVYTGSEALDLEVQSACGADLMSDVMAFVKEKVVLLTGLVNPQALRTADLLDIRVIVFVRGKAPSRDMIETARESGMILLSTNYSMFIACGRLFEAGLRAGGTREIS